MNHSRHLITRPIKATATAWPLFSAYSHFGCRGFGKASRSGLRSLTVTPCSRAEATTHRQSVSSRAEREQPPPSSSSSSSPSSSSSTSSNVFGSKTLKLEAWEEDIEKVIYRCRFLAILGVLGSLVGSFLCFIKGCTYVASSYLEYFVNRGKVILLLVEAIDVYLLGTVMLVFGMGLYELFVSNLDIAKLRSGKNEPHGSNLFGLFKLKERPRWLEIKTVNELKTKLGHVIVMLLLIGFFEKSKTAVILTPRDLLCFSASVLLCSGCLYLLSKLSDSK